MKVLDLFNRGYGFPPSPLPFSTMVDECGTSIAPQDKHPVYVDHGAGHPVTLSEAQVREVGNY